MVIHLVLAAAPLTASGCLSDNDQCTTRTETEVILVSEPPPQSLEMLVRACEADPSQCYDFCRAAFEEKHPPDLGVPVFQTCTVMHRSEGHELTVIEHVPTACPNADRPRGLAQ